MKFRIASLLSLLSGIALINTPVLSIDDLDGGGSSSHVPSKPKEVLTVKRGDLEDFLSKQDYPEAFKSLRATLPTTYPDAKIVDFLMTSNKYPGWTELDPDTKGWVIAKITTAKRRALEDFLSQQDYSGAFKSLRTTLPTTYPDAKIVDFLMTSNKYPGWDKVDPEDKDWVVSKMTKRPNEEASAADEKRKTTFSDLPPSVGSRLTPMTSERAMRKSGRRLPSRKRTLPSKHVDESTVFSSSQVFNHGSKEGVEEPVAANSQRIILGGVPLPFIDFSKVNLKRTTNTL